MTVNCGRIRIKPLSRVIPEHLRTNKKVSSLGKGFELERVHVIQCHT